MTDKQQRPRELLAAEFRRDGLDQVADSILSGHAIPNDARSLRAIAAALLDAQPARGEVRSCTCHSDDRPKIGCQHRYAATDCQETAARLLALPDEQPAQGELEPCPWCCSTRICEDPSNGCMYCEKCSAMGPGAGSVDAEEAKRRWNTRLLAPSAGSAVEGLLADMRERCAELADNHVATGYMSGRERDYCHEHGDEIAELIRALPLTTESQNG